MDTIQETWVINMDKCTDRLERIVRRLSDADVKFNRFSACLPNDPALVGKSFGTPGQMACALSHYKIWRDCYDRGLNRVMILEDDVIFRIGWRELLNAQLVELDATNVGKLTDQCWQMLHINPDPVYWNSPDPGYGVKDSNRAGRLIKLAVEKAPTHSTGGYIINRNGIEFLLDFFKNGLAIADYMTIKLQYCDRSYTYYPYLCFQEEYESFVSDSGGLITKKQLADYVKNHHTLYDLADMAEFNNRYEMVYGHPCF
jgi:GR25 family glycosyltransferase involved in LPS biosynthesis